MKLGGREHAYILAAQAHRTQVDKGGQPYIEHPRRVAAYVEIMGGNDEDVTVAYLHDVVEDTPVTLLDLTMFGFSFEVVAAVDALSRREGETNREYVLRVAENEIAVLVKRADYLDNLDPARMAKIDPEDAKRLIRTMTDSQKILGFALIDRAAR